MVVTVVEVGGVDAERIAQEVEEDQKRGHNEKLAKAVKEWHVQIGVAKKSTRLE